MQTIQRSPDPFYYQGEKTGILLIHGFTGSPSEMRPMGEYFRSKGYSIYAPLLAGHGTTPEELRNTTWQDWWNSVKTAYQQMVRDGMNEIFVVGLSMGGALSLFLASEERVNGVVSLCAPIWVRDRRIHFVDVIQYFLPYISKKKKKLDAYMDANLLTYDRTPLRSVGNLNRLIREVKKRLPKVDVPTLVVQARNDQTVDPKSALYIYENIASKLKKISWYEKSSHIITLDKERRQLFAEIESFIKEVQK